MNVDYVVIFVFPDLKNHPKQVFDLGLLFIPDQNGAQVRMALQQFFIPFSHQKINGRIGIVVVNFFDQCSSQNDIANKSCLYDEEGRRARNHRVYFSWYWATAFSIIFMAVSLP